MKRSVLASHAWTVVAVVAMLAVIYSTAFYRGRIDDITTALGRRQQAEVLAGTAIDGWYSLLAPLSRPIPLAIWYYDPELCHSCNTEAAHESWGRLDGRWPGASVTVVVGAAGSIDAMEFGGIEPSEREIVRSAVTEVWTQLLRDALLWSLKIVINDEGRVIHAEGALPVECYWSVEDKLLTTAFRSGAEGECLGPCFTTLE